MTPEQKRAMVRQLLAQGMMMSGGSRDPAGTMKRAGMSEPPGPLKNYGGATTADAPSWRDSAEREYSMRGGFPLTKEFKRADMSGLPDDVRQEYLRQSFVAPGQFPDQGMNGGLGGGMEYLRQLYMRQSRPIWLQEAINNGDFDPELLDRIARGG